MEHEGCYDQDALELYASRSSEDELRGIVSDHLSLCAACRERLSEVEANLTVERRARAVLGGALTADVKALPEVAAHFRILRELGRGSMGIVFLAEQEHPRRRVALKLIPTGPSAESLARRIEYEANVLAQLRHPGIAQVYEAGEKPSPYFAMEFVEGERIDHFVERSQLDLRGRLELLAQVCDAVEHAHAHGVIHRDLKPSNILVDAHGHPRILDFGIARVIGASIEALTVDASPGQLIGTLPFMSPEQLLGDPSQIDAQSDVYALGVIGYLLLCRRLPYDLKECSLAEAARIIRDDAPTPLRAVVPGIARDVETMLLKALEKERPQRYRSAAQLAADLRRYLRREPILARPPSSWYQARRFAQRNPALSSALTGLVLVLTLASVVSTVMAVRARRAENEAQEQAARYESVSRFLQDMLAAPSPEENPGQRDTTVREVFANAVADLDEGSLRDQPAVELGVRTTLGDTYRALGDLAAAEVQLTQAVTIGRAFHPQGHADLALAINKLARVLEARADYERAEALLRECLSMRRALFGKEHVDVATSLNNLADLRRVRGDPDEALRLHEEALRMRRRLLGPAHGDIANSLNNLATLLYEQGRRDESAGLFRQSLEMDIGLRGELHPHVVLTMNNLATVLSGLGQVNEAESLFARVLQLNRELYGEEHPSIATALNNLALHLLGDGRVEEAVELLRESVDLGQRLSGQRHPRVANSIANLARALAKQQDHDQAERLYLEALQILEESFGLQDHRVQKVVSQLVDFYDEWRRPQLAAQWRARLVEPER